MALWTWLTKTIASLVQAIFGRRAPTPDEVKATEGHIVYIVQPGDTLWGIAQRYGTTVEKLVELNHIEDPGRISVGQKLLVPTAGETPSPPPSGKITWTRKLTGFYGNRWQAWEQFVEGKVPGITWQEFKDQALVYNPQLQADGYVFRKEKEYLLPEIGHEPTPPPPPPLPPPEGEITWTRKLTGFYGNRWQAWEQFVQKQVPGITWYEFKDQALVYNPHLEADGYIFRPEKEYLLPEINHEPLPPPPPPSPVIKGLYVTYLATRHAGLRSHVLDLLETTELNAVVIDIKGDDGTLYETFTQPDISSAQLLVGTLANEAAGHERAELDWIVKSDFPTERYAGATDFTTLMDWLKKHGIYTIARVVVFKDNRLVSQRPDLAVKDDRTGQPWRAYDGATWADPYLPEVWEYNMNIAVETARRGFDEIQYDYVRWPTDGPTEHAQFAKPNTVENRAAAMNGFLALTRSRLKEIGAKLAVDFFGYTCWRNTDTGIGQVIEGAAPHIDVLCPMLYPSTFGAGLPGYPQYNNAIAFPYEVVYMSSVRAVRRLKIANPAATVRPWIQDFPDYAFDKRTYTPQEIREQMRGAMEAGCSGWMLWDPRVRYTREALLPEEPPPPPPPSPPPIPTYPPNKMGQIVVLEYHSIAEPEGRWQRTPDNFRADLEYLLSHGYYPVNLIDMVRRNLGHVPRGRRPIVLTFDDSSEGQFRYLADGSIDPNCAAGILKTFHDAHPDGWPLRATFFVLLNADKPGVPLFRQGDTGPQKVRTLVEWGMEIGSHTINHRNLSQATPEQIRWELAVSQNRIEALIPGHQVRSFSPPFGAYPADLSLLKEGYCESENLRYTYEAAVKVGGEPSSSPLSSSFDPYRIPRVQAFQDELNKWLGYFERYPERYYVSDGGK